MKPFKLDDLPPAMRAQALAVLAGKPAVALPTAAAEPDAPAKRTPGGKLTKTENSARDWLERCGKYSRVRVHPFTLRMDNGHRYTPDFLCTPLDASKPRVVVEVKGSYRLHSYGRARLAFDQARLEYPEFAFVWMEKTKTGWATVETTRDEGR